MTRLVQCAKLDKELEGLNWQTYPGPLGERIYLEISQQAWNDWMQRQTMLINEYRLTPMEPKSRSFLEEEMEKFLFGDGGDLPEDFVPPTA